MTERRENPSPDLISVGITCFNAEKSIEKAVRSAQDQTWQPIEIVAVDDCSTDNSWSILEGLALEDGRLRVIRHLKNKGVGAARNSILKNARGSFVAFFDDDDASRPERLAEQHRRITEYERDTGSSTVLCFTATERLYPDGEVEYLPCLGMDMTPAPAGIEVARLILLGEPVAGSAGVCPTCSQMARREVYQLAAGFDERLTRHEDTDLNLRLVLKGAHIAGMSNPLVVQTMTFARDKSVSEEHRNAMALIDKHGELLREWNWYNFSRLWCEMKFALLDGGVRKAFPYLMRLLFTSPVKLVRKTMWALPNRKLYRRFTYSHDSSG
jgi:glycosyltransferase involved in cell wall biosynthesis